MKKIFFKSNSRVCFTLIVFSLIACSIWLGLFTYTEPTMATGSALVIWLASPHILYAILMPKFYRVAMLMGFEKPYNVQIRNSVFFSILTYAIPLTLISISTYISLTQNGYQESLVVFLTAGVFIIAHILIGGLIAQQDMV